MHSWPATLTRETTDELKAAFSKEQGARKMAKRIPFAVVLTLSLVMLGGMTSAAAQPNRKITGSWQWDWPGFHDSALRRWL